MSEVVTGKAMWASVAKPNTKFEPQWQIDIIVDMETAKKLQAQGLKLNKKDGNIIFRPNRKCTNIKGQDNSPPLCFDAHGNRFDDPIGNGSIVEVQYSVYAYKKIPGNGADLEAVRVVDLIPYKKTGDDVDVMFKFTDPLSEDNLFV